MTQLKSSGTKFSLLPVKRGERVRLGEFPSFRAMGVKRKIILAKEETNEYNFEERKILILPSEYRFAINPP